MFTWNVSRATWYGVDKERNTADAMSSDVCQGSHPPWHYVMKPSYFYLDANHTL